MMLSKITKIVNIDFNCEVNFYLDIFEIDYQSATEFLEIYYFWDPYFPLELLSAFKNIK